MFLRRTLLKGLGAAFLSLFGKRSVAKQIPELSQQADTQFNFSYLDDYYKFVQTPWQERMDLQKLIEVSDFKSEWIDRKFTVEEELKLRGLYRRKHKMFCDDGSPDAKYFMDDGEVLPSVNPKCSRGNIRGHIEYAFKLEKWKLDPPVSSMG